MSKIKIPLSQAQALADKIIKELSPVCAKIQVAGSIRRQKPEVGDIEIVCIPKPIANIFGDEVIGSNLDPHLAYLQLASRIVKGDKWGPKYKKFHIPAMPELSIDLFITTPEEWGYTLTIRTGSADFSRRIVTPKQQGGFLPGHLRVAECRLWENGIALKTPEEEDFFRFLGLEWIEPEKRV